QREIEGRATYVSSPDQHGMAGRVRIRQIVRKDEAFEPAVARCHFQREAGEMVLAIESRRFAKLDILVETRLIGKDGSHAKRIGSVWRERVRLPRVVGRSR